MSVVDNRIVKLAFDNEQFEAGVSKSMQTLERLEEKLQFKKSAQGLSALQVGIDGVNFEKLAAQIDAIEKRLGILGTAGAEVVKSITQSLISGLKSVESATIGQITSGGWSRAMNLENARFTIEGLKLDWQEMLKAINYGVLDTAYGLDAAASAASQLAASGVSYKESIDGANDSLMHKSLRAISGVAAMTNSSYEEISRIFASAAGQGAVMGDTLMQLATRGLNAAAIMADYIGTDEADIRDMASKRLISFEDFAVMMDDAFGAHAKEANKTFNGALSNMKAALSRFGAVFATPIVQKTNMFFIALTDQIKAMKNAISDSQDALGNHIEGVESHFATMWQSLIDMSVAIIDNVNLDWFYTLAQTADNVILKLTDAFNAITSVYTEVKNAVEDTWDLTTITEKEAELVGKVVGGAFGNGATRAKKLGEEVEALNKKIDDHNAKIDDAKAKYESYPQAAKDALVKAGKAMYGEDGEFLVNLEEAEVTLQEKLDAKKIQAYVNVISAFGYNLEKAGIQILKVGEDAGDLYDPFEELVNIMTQFYDGFTRIFSGISEAISSVRTILSYLLSGFSGAFDLYSISDAFFHLGDSVYRLGLQFGIFQEQTDSHGFRVVSDALWEIYYAGQTVGEFLSYMLQTIIYDLRWVVELVIDTISEWKEYGLIDAALQHVTNTLYNLGSSLLNIWDIVKGLGKAFIIAFLRVWDPEYYLRKFDTLSHILQVLTGALVPTEDVIYSIADVLTGVFRTIRNVKEALTAFVKSVVQTAAAIFHMSGYTEEGEVKLSFFGVIIGTVLGIVAKFAELIAMVPDLVTRFLDALSQHDGVIRLGDAIDNLFNAIAASDEYKGFMDWLEGLKNQAESALTVENVADAVGNLASKLAELVENLPEYIKKIKEFFQGISDLYTAFISPILGKENKKSRNQMSKGESVAEQIGQDIKNAVSSLDLKSIIHGGFESAAIITLLQLTSLLELAKSIFWMVDSIGYAIFRIVWKFGTVLSATRRLINSFAVSAFIATIGIAGAALFGALTMFVEVADAAKPSTLTNVIVILGMLLVAIYAISHAMLALEEIKFQRWGKKTPQFALVGVLSTFVEALGIVMEIVAIGYLLKQVMEAFLVFSEWLAGLDPAVAESAMMNALLLIGSIFLAIFVLLVMMLKIGQKIRAMSLGAEIPTAALLTYALQLAAMAAVIGVIGAAVWLLVQSLKEVAELDYSIGNAMLFLGILGAVTIIPIGIFLILQKTQFTAINPTLVFGFAAIIAAMAVMVLVIVGALSLLAKQLARVQEVGAESLFSKTLLYIAVVLLLLSAGIAILLVAMRGMSVWSASAKAMSKAIVKIVLSLVVLIAAMAFIMSIIATKLILLQISGVDVTALNDLMSLMLGTMLVVLGGLSLLIFALGKSSILAMNDKAIAMVLGRISLMVLALAASMAIVSYAVSQIASAITGRTDFIKIVGVLGLFALFIVGVLLVTYKIWKTSTVMTTTGVALDELLLRVVGAIAIMAAAILGVAYAAKMLVSVPWESFGKIGVIIGAFVAILVIFVAAAMLIPGAQTAMLAVAVFFLTLGAASLVGGLGVLALAAGLAILTPLLAPFAVGLSMVLGAAAEHPLMFMVIVAGLILLAFAATTLGVALAKVARIIATAVVTIVKAIFGGLSTIGKGAATWFKNSSASMKVLVGMLIFSVLAALSDNGPAIFKALGNLLIGLMDFLAQAVGPVVEKLIDILLQIIDGLITAINDNIDVIEALIYKLLIVLFNILIKTIGKLVLLLFDKLLAEPIGWLLNKIPGVDIDLDGVRESFQELMGWMDLATIEFTAAGDAAVQEALEQRDALRNGGSAWDKFKESQRAASDTAEESGIKFNLLGDIVDKMTGSNNALTDSVKDVKLQFGSYPQAMKDAMVAAGKAAYGQDGAFFTHLAENMNSEAINDALKKNLGAWNGDQFFTLGDYAEKDANHTEEELDGLADYLKKLGMGDGLNLNTLMDQYGSGEEGSLFDMDSLMGDFATNGDVSTFDFNALATQFGVEGEADGDSWQSGFLTGIDGTSEGAEVEANAMMDSVQNTIRNRTPDIVTETSNMSDAITDTLRTNGGHGMQEATTNMLIGLRMPINAFATGASDVPGSGQWLGHMMAQSIITGFTSPEAMDEHSPSKTMARLGGFVLEGLNGALVAGESGLSLTMENLSDAMLVSFGNPLDRVAMMVDGKIPYDTSIRPVLDTTQLDAGAAGINSLFNNQNVTLSGFSGRLAADISGLDSTNSQVVNELRALRSDMNLMAEEIAGMQIVMDGGQLVGAIATDMDNALGRRAIFRGRGN